LLNLDCMFNLDCTFILPGRQSSRKEMDSLPNAHWANTGPTLVVRYTVPQYSSFDPRWLEW